MEPWYTVVISYFTDILYTEGEKADGTMIYSSNELLNRYSWQRKINNRWNRDISNNEKQHMEP